MHCRGASPLQVLSRTACRTYHKPRPGPIEVRNFHRVFLFFCRCIHLSGKSSSTSLRIAIIPAQIHLYSSSSHLEKSKSRICIFAFKMGCKNSRTVNQDNTDQATGDVPISSSKKTRRDSVAIHKKHIAKRRTNDKGDRGAPAGMKVEVFD